MMIQAVRPPMTRKELIRAAYLLLQDAFADCATVGPQTDGVALAFDHQVEEELSGDLVFLLLDRDEWLAYRDSLEGKTDQADDDDDEPISFKVGVN